LIVEDGAQIVEAIPRESVLAVRQQPPDRHGSGDLADFRREGLDHDRTVVADVAQSSSDRPPRQVILARRPAIVRTRMKFYDAAGRPTDRGWNILFFDIHVEGVEQKADIVCGNFVDHSQPLVDRVDKIGLETVQRLDR
jgi:hypothetical protein